MILSTRSPATAKSFWASCIVEAVFGQMVGSTYMKTAWVFPGQGSQAIGMVADLAEIAAAKFATAQEILGWSVLEISETPELQDTRYTQPCLYVIESILVDLLRAKGQEPTVVTGHSLGEYVALYAAGVFDFATGLKLVKKRGELMSQAAGGKMVALIGFDRAELITAIQNTADVVLANDNSAAQVVVSGSPAGVDTLVGSIKTKRALPLKVSGAFHSHLMADAAAEFAQVLETSIFADAQIPVLSNVEPKAVTDAAILKERLSRQMTGSVRWLEICQELTNLGIDQATEIGPGKVLTGLIGRTCPEMTTINISSNADVSIYTN
jgi:[acyl-carrier-protein] S-malonyltransferase